MILTFIAILIIFSAVVFVHELGHFVAARRNGIEVEEFGFGFPPRAWGVKRGRTIYSINWLPLGGFVRMKGEDAADMSPGTFGAARLRDKVKVLVAGVGMNLLMAYLILVGLCIFGLPKLIDGQFSMGPTKYAQTPSVMAASVVPNSPADKAGIKSGMIIVAGDGTEFLKESDLTNFTKSHAGFSVKLTVKDGDAITTKTVKLNDAGSDQGQLGVTPLKVESQTYGWRSPIVAAGITVQLVWRTLLGILGLFGGLFIHQQVSADVAGPVGIFVILSNVMNLGMTYVWVFILTISISLAVINILPIPALDGGRLALVLLKSKVKGITTETENKINRYGFMALLALMALITIVDVRRFF